MAKKFTTEEIQEILGRYRSGQCTAEESEIIEKWYRSFEDRDVSSIVDDDPQQVHELKVRMFEDIANKITLAEQAPAHESGNGRPIRKLYSFENLRRIAAVLLLGTTIGMFFYTRNATVDRQADTVVNVGEPLAEQFSTATAPGTIYLSDGSVVWLKGGSRLEYPAKFSGDSREVTLVGEAFFDVAPNREKPFIIHSANFTTRVLGTSFNIKAYGNDDAQEVVVVTGEVVVSAKEPSDKPEKVVLTPNQKAVYSRKKNSLVAYDAVGSSNYNTFKVSKLAFDEVSLEDIVNVLNATYDAKISLANEEMRRCIITADLTNESPEVGIQILSKAINASVAIDGKNVVLSGSGCGPEIE